MKHSVLIKPLGVLVTPDNIGDVISFTYEEKHALELVRDETILTSPAVYVRESAVVTVMANIFINPDVLRVSGKVAEEFNAMMRAEVLASVERDNKRRNQVTANVEETPAPKRRGRRPRVEEVAPVEADTETLDIIDTMVDERLRYQFQMVTFPLERVTLTGDAVPIQDSEAIKRVTSISERNEEALVARVARVRALVARYGERMQMLNNHLVDAPPSDDILSAYTGNELDDTATRRIDEAGLTNHRQRLRTEAEAYAERIRGEYTWLEQNMLRLANKNSSSMTRPFEQDEIRIGGDLITRDQAIKMLFTDILVEMKS